VEIQQGTGVVCGYVHRTQGSEDGYQFFERNRLLKNANKGELQWGKLAASLLLNLRQKM
jgi:hypothetical protein